MKEIKIWARQGDLNINPVEGEVRGLTESGASERLVIAGSHEGEHYLPPGTWFKREGQVTFVRVEEPAPLKHASADRHADTPPLQPGVVYRIWPEIERFGKTDQSVQD